MRYTKTEQDYWTSREGRKIAKLGTLGFAVHHYLKAGAMSNYSGIYYIDTFQASGHLAMSEEILIDYIIKFEQLGLVKYDRERDLVWLINAAEQNIGELKAPVGGKPDLKVVCVRKEFAKIDKASPLRLEFHAKHAAMLKLLPLEDTPMPVQLDLAPSPIVEPAVEPVAPVELVAEAAAAAYQYRTYEDCVQGLWKVVQKAREMRRSVYARGGDGTALSRIRELVIEHGESVGTQLVVKALLMSDLSLIHALKQSKEIVVATELETEAVEIYI